MTTSDYRRELTRAEWLQVRGMGAGDGAGAGLGVALGTTYRVRIHRQKTPVRGRGAAAGPPEARDG
jgi:hypothetical protein